jgi:hypothetical protein
MENYNKIIELLQKKNLSAEEKNLLDSLLDGDNSEELLNAYNLIEKSVKKNFHISTEDIGDYILIKNNQEPVNKNIFKVMPLIEEHFRKCPKCNDEFKLLNNEYTDIDNFLLEKPLTEAYIDATPAIVQHRKKGFTKYAFTSVMAAAAVYFLMAIFSGIFTSQNYKLAGINEESEFYVTRGRVTEDFQKSLNALEEKDYPLAIEYLKKDIAKNSEDETIFYSYYIAGLSYLELAEKNFLGLFPSYDKASASLGLHYLELSIENNNSGKFNNLSLDAYFYMAKANLMLSRENDARRHLTKVISGKGSKMEEAKNILQELE